MKKSRLKGTNGTAACIIGIACAMVFSSDAAAQSSVTLYGIIDTGITYISNQQTATGNGISGKPAWAMTTGNDAPSEFGIKGSEDIGGGTAVIFDLRNYYLSSNGALLQSGSLFNGSAFVGVASARFGTLTLGRQFDSFTDALSIYAASINWGGPSAAHFGDVDNLNGAFNVNNTIKYLSPIIAGFTLGGTFGLGNQPGDFSRNRAWAVSLSYAMGPISLAAGYLSVRNPFDAVLGGASSYIGEFSCGAGVASYCSLQDADKMQTYGIGGSYTIGPVTLGATLTRTQLSGSRYLQQLPNGPVTDVRFDNAEVNALVYAAPDLQFGVSYTYAIGDLSAISRKAIIHKASLGSVYSLSKRTQLYLLGTYEHAAGDGIGIDPTNGAFGSYAQIPYFGSSSSANQLAVSVGIKHAF
jgi:predicted porin